MTPAITQSLARAEEAFYSQRLIEAYNLLRRFYDRIPFAVDENHAKYMGMFVRVLLELGKEKQLQFYLAEIEKKYNLSKSDDLAYQLGVIHLTRKDFKQAYPLLNQVVRSAKNPELVVKSKMCLMNLYCQEKPANFVACRSLISSISRPVTPRLGELLLIWDANILRYEKKFEESQAKLRDVLTRISRHDDWYTHFSAQIILAWLYKDQQRHDELKELLAQIKSQFEILSFKSVMIRIEELEAALKNHKEFTSIAIADDSLKGQIKIKYQDKSLLLNSDSVTDKLLLQIMKEGFLPKKKLLSLVSTDEKPSEQMNQAIHSKLSMVRKRLRVLGLPSHAIVAEEEGYRFVPDVVKESTL